MITVFFVEVAIIAGWWTAEIGRQPWVVYNVLLTADGVSPAPERRRGGRCRSGCSSSSTPCCSCSSCICSTRKIQVGPEPLEEVETVEVSSLPDTFRESSAAATGPT